jgi:hypothetical protein
MNPSSPQADTIHAESINTESIDEGGSLNQGVKTARICKATTNTSTGTTVVKGRTRNHGLDWLDAADGLLGEREADRHSAQQFTADIHRAATHTLQNAGFSQRAAAQSGEDEGLLWPEILQDSEDLDLELLNPIPLEDGFSDSAESRSDILNWEEFLTPSKRG